MPYIPKEDRVELHTHPERKIATAGELNFMLTEIITMYLHSNGKGYQQFNDCIGALEGCKMELYRRLVVPYEDVKIGQNGDVY